MAQKVEFELVAKTSNSVKEVEQLNKKVKEVGKSSRKTNKELSGGAQVGKEAIRGLDRQTSGLATKLVAVGKAAKLSGKAMKTALISSGIGLAVVALGLIVEHWDKISGLINGVSGDQKDILASTEKTLVAQEKQLSATNSMESTLKLQGKTEKEIRDLKRQQTNEIITSTELLLEQQQAIKKTQVEAAERNKKITAGIVSFLSLPITMLLGAVDALTFGLAKLGVIEEATSLAEDAAMGIAGLLFDPEEVSKEGDAVIEETENKLRKLKNTRDSFLLQDKKVVQEKSAEEKSAEEEAEKEKAAAIERIRKGLIDTEAEERAEKLRLIKEDYDQQIALAAEFYGTNSIKILELKAAQKLAEDEQQALFDEQDKERKKKKEQDEKDAEKLRKKTISDDLAEKARIEKEAAKHKENEYQETYGNLQTIVSAGGKKLEKVGKALAIANIARSSFQSISETVSSTGAANAKAVLASPLTSGMPFVAINTIKAALSIGATLASAKKSISAITSNSKNPSGSSPSASGGGGGGGGRQPPAFNVVGSSGTNQLASAIGGQTKEPVKAFVVSNDVTTSQELERNIISNASIG